MSWDHRYRMLEKDEVILSSDEVQEDDGSWSPATERCVGTRAPDPCYTSHRIYRRAR